MKKISLIFGTRPEVIKLAPLILELQKYPDKFRCHICVTAQHRQMLDQTLEVFGIAPDTDLDLMEQEQTLAGFTSKALIALDNYLKSEMPYMVVIQGDTTTVFCAALAAFYRQIPVAHVEAGLRTGNIYAPWPEEMNRILASRLTTLHFTPTEWSRDKLLREGVSPEKIFITGNTVVDALLLALIRIEKNPPILPNIIQELIAKKANMVLITGHRRENFGQGFENICTAIARLAETFPTTHFIYPVHLNPNVIEPVHRILQKALNKNIHLLAPVPYLSFIALMKHACVILTDSGGIQEEAPSLGKPVIVMRDTTERPEGVEAGVVTLVGTDPEKIVKEVSRHLTDSAPSLPPPPGGGDPSEPGTRNMQPETLNLEPETLNLEPETWNLKPETRNHFFNPYGDGTASVKIVAILKNYFKE